MNITVNKWGHSLGLRIPKEMARRNEIREGQVLKLTETDNGILLERIEPKITLDSILDSIPENYSNVDLIPRTLESEEW